jgi:uncharacterized protein (DUF433 family)
MVQGNDDAQFDRVALDDGVVGGRPRIAGTRVPVSDIVEMLAHGATRAEILADYPYLTAEYIAVAVAYAAKGK